MLKLDRKPLPAHDAYLSRPEPEPSPRLFVVVPSIEVDISTLTRRVYKLVDAGAFHVQFIGLCSDTADELTMRRVLITMSSMVNHGNVTSDVEVIFGKSWVDTLNSRLKPTDMVVYWDVEPTSSIGRPLSLLLRANLNAPLYVIPGRSAPREIRSAWTSQAAAWIGFTAIVLGFCFLQVKIYQLANSLATTLTLISVAVEFWLIWVWHSWFK